MRSLALLGLVVALLGVTALVSPWAAWAAEALLHRGDSFSRVYDRVFEVLLAVGLLAAWRRLDLGGAAELGLARRGWARELGAGLGIGLAGVGVGLALAAAGGGLAPDLRYPALKTLRKVLLGIGAAGAIGLGEEVLFRGVLLRRLVRDGGRALGVAATTAIYAAVHAIGRPRGQDALHAWSGVERTAALFAPLADASVLPSLAGLVALGLVLAAARLGRGSLWVPIGIHAAWVGVFRVGRLFFDVRPEPAWLVGPGWPPLVGGAAGLAGVAATALLLRRRGR